MAHALRVVLRLVVIVVVALMYVVVVGIGIAATKPFWQPNELARAVNSATREASEKGESSICGIELSPEIRRTLREGGSIGVASPDDRPLAECLNRLGYLTDAELVLIEQYEKARQWRWWERTLFIVGLAAVITGTAFLLFRSRPSTSEPRTAELSML
jgi:hypothetical protein